LKNRFECRKPAKRKRILQGLGSKREGGGVKTFNRGGGGGGGPRRFDGSYTFVNEDSKVERNPL